MLALFFYWSGCRESNSGYMTPSHAYYLYTTPRAAAYIRACALMHLAHANTLLPLFKRAHCKLGYFLTLVVGLNFPRNFTSLHPIDDVLLHIEQILLAIVVKITF